MVEREGMWPEVVAIVGGADMYCLSCARKRYGEQAIAALIEGRPGYERLTDHEKNPLTVVLDGSEDVQGMCCGNCFLTLDDTDDGGFDDEGAGPLEESCVRCGMTTSATCDFCGRPLCWRCDDGGGCGWCD